MEMLPPRALRGYLRGTGERLPRERDLGNIGEIPGNARRAFHGSLVLDYGQARVCSGESQGCTVAREDSESGLWVDYFFSWLVCCVECSAYR